MTWFAVFLVCSAGHCREINIETSLSVTACHHALPAIGADLMRAKRIKADERISKMQCEAGEPT